MGRVKEMWTDAIEAVQDAYKMHVLSYDEAHKKLVSMGVDKREAFDLLTGYLCK